MKKVWLSFFSVLLLAAGSSAWSATISLGSVGAGDLVGDGVVKIKSPVAFADEWTFTLTDNLIVSISVDANDSPPSFNISNFLVISDSPLIVFSFQAADNRYSFDGVLPADTYTFDVTGVSSGSIGGSYIGTVGATLVPIPAAAWLFGSALLGLVAVGRRKNAAA